MSAPTFDAAFYTGNRESFTKQLNRQSVCIINTYDALPRSADQFFPHKPNPDLMYLTGIAQEETLLVIFPDAPNPSHREMLFISDRNEAAEVWYGKRLSKEEATAISGIKNINWLSSFNTVLRDLMAAAREVYLDYNEYPGYSGADIYKNLRFINAIREAYPLHVYNRAYPIISRMRMVKQKPEIEHLRHAINISAEAFNTILKKVRPGIAEYEVEAELSYTYLCHNARFHGFQPIVASGLNACYLHYNSNHCLCNDGDLILIDTGAEYQHYTSDITRTIPVNGRFSKRQKEVYNTVLNVQKEVTKLFVTGATINEVNTATAELIQEGLNKLGLLNENDIKKQNPDAPLYKKYYPHGVSHFLGMDAHDSGNKFVPFKPGMVLTCEPGIYIFEEKIGIRLENDILITRNGPVNLSAHIPIEPEEIEALMAEKKKN